MQSEQRDMRQARKGAEAMKLTVILRNDSPMIHCGDSPSYRSVQIELTQDQCEAIKPRWTGMSSGTDEYESISKAFLEPEKEMKS
jgi:hypothetical protein